MQALRDWPQQKAVALTRGPAQHFFGYFNLCPWSPRGDRVVVHQTTTTSPLPRPDEEAEILVIRDDFDTANVVGSTTAWNWQQGSLLQWLDADRIVFNVRAPDGVSFRCRVVDTTTGATSELGRALYAVSPSGDFAYTVDFARLHVGRPGYGYTLPREVAVDPAPVTDGVWRVDLANGEDTLLIPLRRLLWTSPHPSMRDAFHWVNHLQINRTGDRLAFIHRWHTADGLVLSRLMVSDPEADKVTCVVDGGSASHYDWIDDRTLVGWFRPTYAVNRLRMNSPRARRILQPLIRIAHAQRKWLGGATRAIAGDSYFRVDVETGKRVRVGASLLREDGHCAVSPDGRKMLFDTYPNDERVQRLAVFDLESERVDELGTFHSPEVFTGSYRCDLHARWSRDGRVVCFDATHDGMRQVYTQRLE